MARTRASVGAKISSGKSSKARCNAAPTTSTGISSGGSEKSSRGSGGGNPVCPRETPKWQKPITSFFINKHDDSRESDGDGDAGGSSVSKSKKRNIIESSDDDTTPEKQKNNDKLNKEQPKNNELDETLELEPLTGEDSHKIQKYYPKGKGIGKKTKETKHINSNGASEKDNVSEGDEKLQVSDENSNDSCNSTGKGKGIGKKTKETKHTESNSTSEKEDTVGDQKTKENNDKNGESTDKENIDRNVNKESELTSDKNSYIVGKKKREREDKLEEGNTSKKIKVN